MIRKIIIFFLFFTGFIFLLQDKIIFPSDNLYLFPSFSIESWKRPTNSLLIDPLFQFEPWRYYAKQRIRHGQFPLWNDNNAGGSPFFANPQTAVLHPFSLLYYVLPTGVVLNIVPLLKLFIMGVFTYLYLRMIKISFFSSFVSGVVAAAFAFPIVWILFPHTNVFILTPLVLWITENILQKNIRLHRWYSLLAGVYLLGVLGGHPETLFHLFIIHIIYLFVRLIGEKTKIYTTFIFIFLGIFAGSAQILPFLEYLYSSYSVNLRHMSGDYFFLPLKSVVINVIPFLLGAPHTKFYKSIDITSNFQEYIGGYTGLIVLVLGCYGMFRFRKERIITLWSSVVLVCVLIAYKVWPFWTITQLPIVNSISNSRLIGFAGFGLIILFALTLDKLRKQSFPIKQRPLSIIGISVFTMVSAIFFIGRFVIYNNQDEKMQHFFLFLYLHSIFLLITSFTFFLLLSHFKKTQSKKLQIGIVLVILSQSLFLFWNYNPLTNISEYYPQTEITRVLQSRQKGPILEVGNFSLPPNTNLVYGLQQAENDDALQVGEYRKEFDKAFPHKNHWTKVDQVNISSLQRFGIKYIISDYNINKKLAAVQPKYTDILPLFGEDNTQYLTFVAEQSTLDGVRILPANYNRLNTCFVFITLSDESGMKLTKQNASCTDFRDKMFYTVRFASSVSLIGNKRYLLTISSPDATSSNGIGLWGDSKNPYVGLLTESTKAKNIYPLLWQKKSIYIFEVPNSERISIDGKYTIIRDDPETLEIIIDSTKNQNIEVKKTFYPGWHVYLSGKELKIENANPFMGVGVPKGKYTLVLQYKPWSFIVGLIISSLVIFSVLGYFVWNEAKIARKR